MADLLGIVTAVLPPFFLMIVGGWSRKQNWLPSQKNASMSRFIVCVLYPCFIVYQVLSSQTDVTFSESWVTPSFGFGAIAIGFLIAKIVGKILSLSTEENRAFSFCSGIFNYGFFAIPVASMIFGQELIVKIILFNLGVEVAIWTVGILVLTSSKFDPVKLFNPPAISVFVALGLKSLGGAEALPLPIWEVISMIGQCSIPLGLMVIGAGFFDLFKDYKISDGLRIECGAVLTRNFLVPALFVLYAAWGWIPHGMEYLKQILVIQAAMPAGVFALLVVNSYGENSGIGLRAIMATMLACLFTMPLWIFLGTNYILK
jgi:predicted permease